jgi:hypothetical protein
MKLFKLFAALLISSMIVVSCSDDDNGTEPSSEQKDLNAATNTVLTDLNGYGWGAATVAHNGQAVSAVDTYRDIFSNQSTIEGDIPVGTIVTKHTYAIDENGEKGARLVTFAMIKREAGYDAANEDWEYVQMPNDGTIDYDEYPNGDISKAAARGKMEMCIGCHSETADGSYLFARNPEVPYNASQAHLDAATTVLDEGVTGTKYGEDVSVGHDGGSMADETIRDMYRRSQSAKAPFGVGSMITKRVYHKNSDGTKGDLKVTFAMIKREAGYDAANLDWEYVVMPADDTVNYSTNPNGELAKAANMGKISDCIDCHSQAKGDDYVFHNDLD